MPLIGSEEIVKAKSGYKFSIVPMDQLGASEYTLVAICCDASASVSSFDKDMESCLKEIIEACKKSPRSENLMLRLIKFNTKVKEIHGFKLLNTVNLADYDGCLSPDGMTSAYDSVYCAIESVAQYGKILTDQDFTVNGIVFCITDGEDNSSKFTPAKIKALRTQLMKDESIESLLVILVGVGVNAQMLDLFKNEAGLDQFVDIKDASKKNLAKLAQFVSQSISSQSQALGTGGPSVVLKI
jgi:uncharacterized protein YegL